ncbi:MAG: single-stranded-DNA-specific exonuclease RecJ [Pseudomonadota bacterium]
MASQPVNSSTRAMPLLGVSHSLAGQRWELVSVSNDHVAGIAQRHGLNDSIARILAARDVSIDDAARVLAPRLRDEMPDPSIFKDMDTAVARTVQAIDQGETITIYGDYDVDGATSSALLIRFFRLIGIAVEAYIPDRLAEGYGLNTPALQTLRANGSDLVITVDCGTQSVSEIAAARHAGLEMIVLDHHQPSADLPPAVAIVNPNRHDEPSDFGYLAACGVTFLFIVALNRALRENGFFKASKPPDLLSLLDLVALGTVCDVMPLRGLNRAFVSQGLAVLADRQNAGLAALCDVAGVDRKPDAYHLGFLLGPRVNAGGRVGTANLGVRLLSSDEPEVVTGLAQRLDGHNADRRAIEAEVQAAARLQIIETPDEPIAIAAGEGWHPGVIGIVASRLKEEFGRPSFVFACENGIAKGSARSIPRVDIGQAVIAAANEGIISAGGGHAMAAGLTLPVSGIPAFKSYMDQKLSHIIARARSDHALIIDALISSAGATVDLVREVEALAPYGPGFRTPRFAISDAELIKADIVGEAHMRGLWAVPGGNRLKSILFRGVGTPLGDTLISANRGQKFHLVGKLKVDTWTRTEQAELHLEDAALA